MSGEAHLMYPWSAVVGQEALKHALLLCAIDPAIGGVLVQGPRGVAKTTLARALGRLIDGGFVELPLGASEERVTGTLDLGAALSDGHVAFSPGLLARAHEGVLYVDEVNLLPDGLVDLLLDAAASGRNVVERDGVSHAHPARFVLLGTMNPDEGELRPQLTDRFGLSVAAVGEIPPNERVEIVTRRLAFESDPARFVARYVEEERALRERCRRAREAIATIPLAGPALELVTELCYGAGVEGLRGDLAMLRAARAHAAWNGRTHIDPADVDAVAELALAHRRRRAVEPPRSGGGGSGSSSGTPRSGSGSAGVRPASGGGSASGGPHAATHHALAPVPVPATASPDLPAWLTESASRQRETRRRGKPRRARALGGARLPSGRRPAGAVDWFASIAAVPGRPSKRAELRYRGRRGPSRQLWVLAIDCSASMLRSGALAAAKGVAHAFELRARRAGAHLAVVTFQGAEARLELAPGARGEGRERAITALAAGGGTPLRRALCEALSVCRSRPFRPPEVGKRLVLLTDGRTRESLDGLDVAATGIDLVVIDCERGPVRLGRAALLADRLGGRAVHVDAMGART